MNVAELIAQLQKMPQDAPVLVSFMSEWDEAHSVNLHNSETKTIELRHGTYFMDHNPKWHDKMGIPPVFKTVVTIT